MIDFYEIASKMLKNINLDVFQNYEYLLSYFSEDVFFSREQSKKNVGFVHNTLFNQKQLKSFIHEKFFNKTNPLNLNGLEPIFLDLSNMFSETMYEVDKIELLLIFTYLFLKKIGKDENLLKMNIYNTALNLSNLENYAKYFKNNKDLVTLKHVNKFFNMEKNLYKTESYLVMKNYINSPESRHNKSIEFTKELLKNYETGRVYPFYYFNFSSYFLFDVATEYEKKYALWQAAIQDGKRKQFVEKLLMERGAKLK